MAYFRRSCAGASPICRSPSSSSPWAFRARHGAVDREAGRFEHQTARCAAVHPHQSACIALLSEVVHALQHEQLMSVGALCGLQVRPMELELMASRTDEASRAVRSAVRPEVALPVNRPDWLGCRSSGSAWRSAGSDPGKQRTSTGGWWKAGWTSFGGRERWPLTRRPRTGSTPT